MTDYQYHKEALRKQRLIERKQEAIRRMDVEEQAPMTPLKTSRDCHTQQLANDRMNELQTEHAEARRRFSKSGVAYDRQMHDHSREGPVRRPTNYEIRKQLYHDAKVLRDHNLVMGPMQAFSIYFDPNKMSWK